MVEREVGAARRRGRPRELGVEQRRAGIIDCAYDAFVELGFSGTTVTIIAARARTSKREIYQAFSGKTELFAAVVLKHRYLLLDLPRLPEAVPMLETLVKIFRLDMDVQRDREREALLNLIMRESVLFPDLSASLYDQGILRSREDLIEWLESEAARGTIVMEDVAVCAGMLMDITFGALLPQRRQAGDAARNERKDHIRKRLEIFLRGVRPPDAVTPSGVAPVQVTQIEEALHR